MISEFEFEANVEKALEISQKKTLKNAEKYRKFVQKSNLHYLQIEVFSSCLAAPGIPSTNSSS